MAPPCQLVQRCISRHGGEKRHGVGEKRAGCKTCLRSVRSCHNGIVKGRKSGNSRQVYLSLTICAKTVPMSKIGNNPNRNDKKPSLKDYNDAWATVRRRAVQRTINLNAQLNQAFFEINTGVVQQQASNAIRGNNVSAATAMSRLNILV
ncbi:hypothetical protein [Pannonibacter phragmitetus]|nr:hypothetical protein [Pannonibacter phragmitetus]